MRGVRGTLAALLAVAAAGTLPGCAGPGATVGSGVGDRLLESPPWYAGRGLRGAGLQVVHFPVAHQQGATQPSFLEPRDGPGSPLGSLLSDLNRRLDDLGASDPFASGLRLPGTPPDVHFGCAGVGFAECESIIPGEGGDPRRRMLLAVGRPSADWTEALATALDEAGADAALMVTLEVGEYWTRQKNLRGQKEVRLGTDHVQDLPWLTSLDQPVQVLQLTGVLVGRDGRAIRIGAEGLLARRTRIVLSAFGAQELITDDDVERLRSLRRDDPRSASPGSRPVWEVALEHLVRELTGRP